ncbi:hypothetical protein GGF46_003162 [Coemansia sp. RSA 552]|nr:hypothetical protein GGF46_003162 [Coemansia sp. RSA 552]
MGDLPSFSLPSIFDNPKGWGPSKEQTPSAFTEIPYVLYSKGDKVSRAANWISGDSRDQRGRGRRDYGQQAVQAYGSSSASAFAYQAAEDEESFSLVDNRGATVAKKIGMRGDMRGRGRGGAGRGGMQRLGHQNRGRGRGGHQFMRRRFGWRDFDRGATQRTASVKPTEGWALVQDIEFSRMSGLSFLPDDAGDLGRYGSVGVYDHAYDRVTTRLEKPLRNAGAVRLNVSASDDPVLGKLSEKDSRARVFATDTVVATLMASTVSTSAWDVVATRVGDKLFLDKRDGGPMDFPSVNENAYPPPPAAAAEGEESINSASMLAMEARDVNRNYIHQVAGKGTVELDHPNPFNSGDQQQKDVSAYRYRLLDLSVKQRAEDSDDEDEIQGEPVLMAVRTEISAVTPGPAGKQMFVRALTQHDVSATGAGGALDWRKKLDSQRGAVIATEMKNNSSKLARWAFQAVLADADQLRVGFVARASPRDRTRHGILGYQTYNPVDFVGQLGHSVFKGWGIVKAMVDLCLGLEEGKYIIMRDPNQKLLQIYSVPANAFDEDEEGGNEEAATNA